jgi:hypothetical protein
VNGLQRLRAAIARLPADGRARAWHYDHREIGRFLRYLRDVDPIHGDRDTQTSEFVRALEVCARPWDWNDEYDEMVRHEGDAIYFARPEKGRR